MNRLDISAPILAAIPGGRTPRLIRDLKLRCRLGQDVPGVARTANNGRR
jgi:hypothetical protein